jgi:hypothetical protein
LSGQSGGFRKVQFTAQCMKGNRSKWIHARQR